MTFPSQGGWPSPPPHSPRRTFFSPEGMNRGPFIESLGDDRAGTGGSPPTCARLFLGHGNEPYTTHHTLTYPCLRLAESHTTITPPTSTIPVAPVGLSDEEIVRITDELLLDEELNVQCPKLLEELASTIPAIAESVEALTREARNIPLFFTFIYKHPSK